MRTLLEHEWARDYAERPGATVVETAADVLAGLQRLASESTDLVWA
jgi:DNA processing protein